MKIALLAGLVALLAPLASPPRAAAQSAPPFGLCADPHNPPLSSMSDTAPGIYLELGQRIAAALDRPFRAIWTPHLFARLDEKLHGGECDGVIGLPEGVGVVGPGVTLSKPLLAVGFALATPPSVTVRSLADLKGKRVAVQFGSPPQQLLSTDAGIDLVTVMTPRAGLDALASGKADAAFLWGPTAAWINHSELHDQYQIKPVAGRTLHWNVGIGVASTDTRLLDAVNQAIAGLGNATRLVEAKYGLAISRPIDLAAATASKPAQAAATPAGPVFTPREAADGNQLLNENCAHCHGYDAVTGLEVRNLRHLKLRYDGRMNQVFLYTVTHGRPAKGMPNWSGILTPAQFHDILAYLHTIQQH